MEASIRPKNATGTRSPVRPVLKIWGLGAFKTMRRHWVGFPLFRAFDALPPTVYIYVNKRGNKKTIQTIHKPYILLFISLNFQTLRDVQFEAQTIHKLYIKPCTEPYTASVQNPTQRAFAELYTKRNTNPTFCFEHETNEWNG